MVSPSATWSTRKSAWAVVEAGTVSAAALPMTKLAHSTTTTLLTPPVDNYDPPSPAVLIDPINGPRPSSALACAISVTRAERNIYVPFGLFVRPTWLWGDLLT